MIYDDLTHMRVLEREIAFLKNKYTAHEMYRTFNCGVGMVIVVPADKVEQSIEILNDAGENAWHIGEIQQAADGEEQVEITGV